MRQLFRGSNLHVQALTFDLLVAYCADSLCFFVVFGEPVPIEVNCALGLDAWKRWSGGLLTIKQLMVRFLKYGFHASFPCVVCSHSRECLLRQKVLVQSPQPFERATVNHSTKEPASTLKPPSKPLVNRISKIFFNCLAALTLGYVLLLIPESHPPFPKGAGKRPFVWNLNAFWSSLEQQFNQNRTAGCSGLETQLSAALSENNRLLELIATKPLGPADPLFTSLETNLFNLAPLAAACPARLHDYIELVTRTRAEVKRQSQSWDSNAPSTRDRIYRLLFGSRLALEEVMLQAPANLDMPPAILGTNEPSQTPALKIFGVTVHSGDILVSRGGAPTSALIARGNDYPGNFSHVALLHIDDKTAQASLIESHIESGVGVSSLEKYLEDKKLRIMVLRLRSNLPELLQDPMLPHRVATAALQSAKGTHIPYDFAMDCRDHASQFCSEVVSAAYEEAGIRLWQGSTFISSPTVTAWLGSVGVRHFETQEPADLEYDPQVTVVAEWRDRSTLLKAHIDDAVTDVMLQQASPGEPLDYQLLLLPPSRLAKAYSFVLNLFGKPGPVPEGMSATTALRVKKYRSSHDAIAARVLSLSDKFRQTQGYTPPYWKLIELTRQATAQTGKRS
ncbi:MAG: hypothetical protein JWM16_5208 [Verrucomicrobiales bacterium]|nr:hypothetical protein [Verrucomicrobiales bacterium]